MSQSLSQKDQAVFRSIVKFYETKQYKKGIKAADSILKKNPDHGETLCMKGLTLSYLDKKDEAYEMVRQGLKKDLKSHVCWHVFGLLYRQDRDYFEAVRCYRQALKIDPDNVQILRDMSLLQIHRRDLSGVVETRRKLLSVKPSVRLNWMAYAVAEHLRGSFELAWTVVENMENMFKDENTSPYETSELIMYKATLMEEAGQLEDALTCVTKQEAKIVDKVALLEMRARLLMFLRRFDEAAEVYRKLIGILPENNVYILGYLACQTQFHRFWPPIPAPKSETAVPETIVSFPQSVHPEGTPIYGWLQPERNCQARLRVTAGQRQHKAKADSCSPLVPLNNDEEEAICKVFEELQADHPKSDAIARVVLYFLSGERFMKGLDKYLRPRIRKGIPSLFRMLKPLYSHEGKADLIEKLMMQYCEYLPKEDSYFGPQQDGDEEEPPQCVLFAWLMTAEHFNFVGDITKALEYVDKGIHHTPTFVEIYSCKARIYKHAGDLKQSQELFDEVRRMDLADRYLNCQSVKAMLRVDDVQQGMDKALLFSREPEAQTGTGALRAGNLHDMQCMWYEAAVARSYIRQKEFGKALKLYSETFRHFQDILEDQFDFHNYCLRKFTLRTYVAMLKLQERLYSHKFYRRAAKDAIHIHLNVFDLKARGEWAADTKEEEKKDEDVSAADKKAKKHAEKRKKKAEDDKKAAEQQKTAPGKVPKKVDEDPDGKKLLEKDHLDEASKLVKTLVLNCANDTATHKLYYEVSVRRGKLLQCLQALIQLGRLCQAQGPVHHKMCDSLAHFCFVMDLDCKEVPAVVKQVVLAEIAPILGQSELKDVAALKKAAGEIVDKVEARLKNAELPIIEVLAGVKCMKHAGRSAKAFLGQWRPEGAFSLKDCKKMLTYLGEEFGADSAERSRFLARCREVFPLFVVERA